MKLYLVQHGEAKSKEEDPRRPLTDRGREDVKRVADFIAKLGIGVDRIVHSTKLRARQTAEIIARELHIERMEESDALNPLADPNVWASKLKDQEDDLMLVGHIPHLSKLVSLLITGREDEEIARFTTGGIFCLERNEEGRWAILWALRPDMIIAD